MILWLLLFCKVHNSLFCQNIPFMLVKWYKIMRLNFLMQSLSANNYWNCKTNNIYVINVGWIAFDLVCLNMRICVFLLCVWALNKIKKNPLKTIAITIFDYTHLHWFLANTFYAFFCLGLLPQPIPGNKSCKLVPQFQSNMSTQRGD